ncbi:type VI secretion system ATPase TssH [Francisella marina]|uniref:Type VI secretion system ATPase TssH n=1 Tax=Francisella marina TaxID=2249302 RepID=A0ABX5ZFK7_9GAMM|nr:type VI secretion system ATPase TssH [Francisella marina]QEO56995.1 type VI secretion system ATPase TssH [Francisella marina]QEO58888.1 type VI secretion system ATPase TssH [Francisella marina]
MSVLVELKTLVKQLNKKLTVSLESAVGLCMSQGNYEITLEHWLIKILSDEQPNDFTQILEHYDISVPDVVRELQINLRDFETGNSGKPLFSPLLLEIIQDAWTIGSLQFNAENIRSGYVFLALLNKKALLSQMNLLESLKIISKNKLIEDFDNFVAASSEKDQVKKTTKVESSKDSDSAIEKYCEDLTQKALDGKIDPVFGRETELDQMLDIFCRRRKNNPILVGEPGVGKTAVVEGLALRIAENDVPDVLKNTKILSLDITLLEAGASVKGEFEKRLTAVIDEIKSSEVPLIVFIDEAHRLIGAGGQAGNDAANILKPALSRGELRTVAATTWKEYKQYFEKDPALTRRFQLVKLDAPNDDMTVTILRGLKSRYTQNHGVVIRDDALRMAVNLSSKYITGKNQPDKAIDLIDTCAARVKVSMSSSPSIINHAIKDIGAYERELEGLLEDEARGVDTDKNSIEALKNKIDNLNQQIKINQEQWLKEKEIIQELQSVHDLILETDDETVLSELIEQRSSLTNQLEQAQDDAPMVFFEVSPDTVAKVVSDWTGVPLGKVLRDESQSLLTLDETLCKRIKGQDQAMLQVAQHLKMSKAGLKTPEQPMGVFLLVGPSGAGKTETALTVADTLFGGESSMCTINMGEYQERHTISRLIGSPPGYVGFGEGGVLTEAVRQRPYSVVLLDEVEKASLDVMNLFYQVFDKGSLTDGEGKEIDFSNTVIFLTSNLATHEITELTLQDPNISMQDLVAKIRPVLSNWFKPALLARTTIIPYFILSNEALKEIATLKLNKFAKQLRKTNKIELTYSNSVLENIADRCKEVETGARNIDMILKANVMPKLSEKLLLAMCDDAQIKSIHIDIDENSEFIYEIKFN